MKDQSSSPGVRAKPPAPDATRLRSILEEADRLRMAGKLVAARKLVEDLLSRIPPYFAALSLLGQIHKDAGDPQAALNAFVRASMLDGRHGPTLVRQAEAYLALRSMDMAGHMLRAAEAVNPDDPDLAYAWGQFHRLKQNLGPALAAFMKASVLAPCRLDIALSLGELQVIMGRYEEAAKTLADALQEARRRPSTAAAASQVLYTFAAHPRMVGELELLKEADAVERLAGKADRLTAMRLAFVRGRALDAAGRYEEAWRAFQRANEIAWTSGAGGDARAGREREELALRHVMSFPAVPEQPFDRNAPLAIFLVGPSRSGKSSLERVIGEAFGDVQPDYESAMAEECIALAATRSRLPHLTHSEALPASASRVLGEVLSAEIAERAGGRRILTNTHPANIRHAGAIVRACRNAFFVFLHRDTEDNALRCYQRLYSDGNGYSYRLGECRRHLSWYREMSDAWVSRLPGRSLQIGYEEFVEGPNEVVDRLAAKLKIQGSQGFSPPPDDRGCAAKYGAWMPR